MTAIIIAVWIFFMASCLWALACNKKCSNQILQLIDQVSVANKASGYLKSYWFVAQSVSYEKHLWRLMTFRDPWSVYPPELAEVRALS